MAEENSRRLFFALWPDEATRLQLYRLQRDLDLPEARRHHPDDLHLTLAFLGQVKDAELPCVLAAGDRTLGAPFELELNLSDYWPRSRVAWVGPGQTPGALTDLHLALYKELAPCGFEPEARPFRAHVTLARGLRDFTGGRLAEPVRWSCRTFALAESGGGPPLRYRVIKKWSLDS